MLTRGGEGVEAMLTSAKFKKLQSNMKCNNKEF